jgi:hypothetical protein
MARGGKSSALVTEEYNHFNPLAVQGLLLAPASRLRLGKIQKNLVDIYYRLSKGALESVIYLTELVKDPEESSEMRIQASQILMQYLVSKPPAQIEAKTESQSHSFTFSASLGQGYRETTVINSPEPEVVPVPSDLSKTMQR